MVTQIVLYVLMTVSKKERSDRFPGIREIVALFNKLAGNEPLPQR